MIKKILIFLALVIVVSLIIVRQIGIRWAEENNMTSNVPADYRTLFKSNYEILPSVNYRRASNTNISHFLVKDSFSKTGYSNLVVYRLAENIDSFTVQIDNDSYDIQEFENNNKYAEVIQNYQYKYLKDPRYLKRKIILIINSDSVRSLTQRKNYFSYYFKMRDLALFYDVKNGSPEVFLSAATTSEERTIPVNLALFIKNRMLYMVVLDVTYSQRVIPTNYLDELLNLKN